MSSKILSSWLSISDDLLILQYNYMGRLFGVHSNKLLIFSYEEIPCSVYIQIIDGNGKQSLRQFLISLQGIEVCPTQLIHFKRCLNFE